MALTLKQNETYQFIRAFIEEHGHSPTIAEIAKGIGIQSRGVVHRYVKQLETLKFISIEAEKHRNIRLIQHSKDILVLAKIQPTGEYATFSPETAQNITKLLSEEENQFAIEIASEAFASEGILPGDLILAQKCKKYQPNDIIIATAESQQILLKKLYINPDGTWTLFPIYSKHLPQVWIPEKLVIQGKMIAILRLAQR